MLFGTALTATELFGRPRALFFDLLQCVDYCVSRRRSPTATSLATHVQYTAKRRRFVTAGVFFDPRSLLL